MAHLTFQEESQRARPLVTALSQPLQGSVNHVLIEENVRWFTTQSQKVPLGDLVGNTVF